MAFRSALDNDEINLPSDVVFLREVARLRLGLHTSHHRLNHHHFADHHHLADHHHQHCSSLDMDEIAHHFNTLSLLQRKNHFNVVEQRPSNLERLIKQPVRSVNPLLLPEHYPFNGGGAQLRQLPSLPTPDPYQFLKPSQMEVDRYLARAMVLKHNEELQNRLQNHNRIPVFHGRSNGGFAYRGGSGFASESGGGGGTGVFHPRIVNATTSAREECSKWKRTGVRKRAVHHGPGQWESSMTNPTLDKQSDCYYHLPPEMGLPRDWTY